MRMMKFKAVNYAMGREVKTKRFVARSYSEAQQIAEDTLKGANALPGSHPMAAAKAQVIGIRFVGWAS